MSTSDAVWSEQGTTPDAIEAALRALLAERHAESDSFVPARVLNMIVFVEDAWSGEIANRLRRVGRYHASRLLVLSYEPGRERLDARATIASDEDPAPGELALLRETVIVQLGDRHMDDLLTIADPLVVTDLPTLLWSPHGHPEAADALLGLAQATLLDSIEEPMWSAAIDRACALSELLYVVDLAWLRSTPWRERVAATFDPTELRPDLNLLDAVTVRHHPDSTVAALLLVGWLASRLGWELEPSRVVERAPAEGAPSGARVGGREIELRGKARAGDRDIELSLKAAPELRVPGLADLELGSESGLRVRLDRGPGGLRVRRRDRDGKERTWTLLGASRGEGGILGEGIRQALLRDPTYRPALKAAQALLPEAIAA
jgi:glucose-6-phosphate dehydrogenase assembly protein OpcA